MSYGLNVEMHKQTEICKRLDAARASGVAGVCAAVLFSTEHRIVPRSVSKRRAVSCFA